MTTRTQINMDLDKIKQTVEGLTQNEKVKEVLNSDIAKNVMDKAGEVVDKVKDVKKEDVENIVNKAKDVLGGLKK
ncbi:MAG: hypothetical protein IJ250_06540 [Bacteroidales bacterium]|nr:hypothetical protein [Bacteroidales bacterium]